MSINIDPVIASRIETAWNQLSPARPGQIASAMLSANQQAVIVTQNQQAPAEAAAAHYLTLAHSALTDDSDQVLSKLQAGVVIDSPNTELMELGSTPLARGAMWWDRPRTSVTVPVRLSAACLGWFPSRRAAVRSSGFRSVP